MASGIRRSKWTPKLAKAIGVRLAALRALLKKNGYEAPYLDEARAMKMVEQLGYSLKKFKPLTPEGLAYKAEKVETGTAIVLHQSIAGTKKKDGRYDTIKRTVEKRLINRLAKLMTHHASGPYQKHVVRKLLTEGGYPGPKWNDEERAIEILRNAGVNVDKFEYLSDTAPNAITLPARVGHPQHSLDPGYLKHLMEQVKLARMILESYAHHWKEEMKAGTISDFISPMEEPIAALHVLRKAYKKK